MSKEPLKYAIRVCHCVRDREEVSYYPGYDCYPIRSPIVAQVPDGAAFFTEVEAAKNFVEEHLFENLTKDEWSEVWLLDHWHHLLSLCSTNYPERIRRPQS